MKQKEFPLLADDPSQWRLSLGSLGSFVSKLPRDQSFDLVVRPTMKDKTLKQLGAIFALWYPYILDKLPEQQVKEFAASDRKGMAKNSLHRHLKEQYLVPVLLENASSAGQVAWVNDAADIGEMLRSADPKIAAMGKGMHERLLARLTLSDINIEQMMAYMRAIEEGMWSQGINVPIPDRFWKRFPPRYPFESA